MAIQFKLFQKTHTHMTNKVKRSGNKSLLKRKLISFYLIQGVY